MESSAVFLDFVTSNARSPDIERSWYFLTILLRIGRPSRPEEISANCSLFYVPPEIVIRSCFIRDSPLALIGGLFVVPSWIATSTLGNFVAKVGTSCLWPSIRIASPFSGRKRIWDDVVRTYSRKRRNIRDSFQEQILFHSGNDKQGSFCEDQSQMEVKGSSYLDSYLGNEAVSDSSKVSGSTNIIHEEACCVPTNGFNMESSCPVTEAAVVTVPLLCASHVSASFRADSSSNHINCAANVYNSVEAANEVVKQVVSVKLPVRVCQMIGDAMMNKKESSAIGDDGIKDCTKVESRCMTKAMQVLGNILETDDTQPLVFSLNEFVVCNEVPRTLVSNANTGDQFLDTSKKIVGTPLMNHGRSSTEIKNSHAQMTFGLVETVKECNASELVAEIPAEVPDSFDECIEGNCGENEGFISNQHGCGKVVSGNCRQLEYVTDTNQLPKNEVGAGSKKFSCELLEVGPLSVEKETNDHIDTMKDMHKEPLCLDREPQHEFMGENNVVSPSKLGERLPEEKYVSVIKQKRSRKHNMPVKNNGPNPTQKMTKNQLEPKVLPTFEAFTVEEEEGSGGYGTVYRARRKCDGNLFAIKCPHTCAHVHHANNELKMLERFGGRNFVIKYEGSFKSGNSECFVLEYVEHDRPEVLKKEIDMFELQWYGYCMFKALASLHKQGVVHRDVKPGNFLFSRKFNKGYLIDFNLAQDLHQKFCTVRNTKSDSDRKYYSVHHKPLNNNEVPSASTSSIANGRSLETFSSLRGSKKEYSFSKGTKNKDRKLFLDICDNSKYRSQGADGSGVTQTKEATSTRTPSAEGPRQPLPCQGRKELINLVQEAMQGLHREPTTISTSQRKRVPAPIGKMDKLVFLTPMPVHSNGFGVPGSAPSRSKGDGKHRREGPCVGTKGFRAPEVLLKSAHQGYKVDIWSAGVTLLYLMIGKSPFVGEPEQNMRDIAKLRGSEELWELAKLHCRDASFPTDLLDIRTMPSMKLQKWCELNTRRHDFLKVVPNSLFDLVDKCLIVNPRLRIDAEEALAHEFFAPCHEALRKNRMRRRVLASETPTSKSSCISRQEEGNMPCLNRTLELSS